MKYNDLGKTRTATTAREKTEQTRRTMTKYWKIFEMHWRLCFPICFSCILLVVLQALCIVSVCNVYAFNMCVSLCFCMCVLCVCMFFVNCLFVFYTCLVWFYSAFADFHYAFICFYMFLVFFCKAL